ncbi:MAG: hypothetical protein A2X46_05340 [Lentisphaerae bacterium GWF2_57_35]|nr:MAG: hypothetical protein A2X46_05340 [Lentisphaerae bacterium GWF2_57_35]
MVRDIQFILDRLPTIRQTADELRDTLLANLIMIGEIPAPTFNEAARVQFLLQRFTECGLQNCSADEKGNGIGLLPGADPARTILLSAPVDTFVSDDVDQAIQLEKDRVIGPFVGDNCLALAAMTSLPTLLDRLQIHLKSHVIFLAAAQSLNRGNLGGLRFFLAHPPWPIVNGICLEGVQLGRLNHICLGMRRGEIVCRLPDNYDWMQFGKSGSIVPMSDVISQISRISLPQRPLTSLVLGSIHGGISYHNIARETRLGFELRSESSEILTRIEEEIRDITLSEASRTGMQFELDIFTRREPGGIGISHPLVKSAQAIQEKLEIVPMLYSTTSALAAHCDLRIPSVTLGITMGERSHELDEIKEWAPLPPMAQGMAQLVGLLLAIDGGLCDDVK